MSQQFVERRLIDWALRLEYTQHDPSRKGVSIEYQLMTEGIAASSPSVRNDGGMTAAYHRHRKDIAAAQKAAQVHDIILRLKKRDREAYDAVTVAFLDNPGRIITALDGGREMGIHRERFKRVFERGCAFVHGALEFA